MAIDNFYRFISDVKPSQDSENKYLKDIPKQVEELAEQKKTSMGMKLPTMRLEGILCGQCF
jgi:RNA processing factor Prp31